jgi:hypothetical protein
MPVLRASLALSAFALAVLASGCSSSSSTPPRVVVRIDAAASTVTICPTRYLVADGIDAAVLRVRVVDVDGAAREGVEIRWEATPAGASITPASILTGADGVAEVKLTSRVAGDVQVRATAVIESDAVVLAAQPTMRCLAQHPGASEVRLLGRQLEVRRRGFDGSLGAATLLGVRGVAWSPASRETDTSPLDPANTAVRRREFAKWRGTDLPLLRDLRANVVRLYLDPGLDCEAVETMNQIHDAGLWAIVTVDDAVNDVQRASEVVKQFRDHPAILAWSLGNELNINRYYGRAASVEDAAQRTQLAAAVVRALDPAHPIIASWGDIDIDAPGLRLADTARFVNTVCTDVDAFSINAFRGASFDALFLQWRSITEKPMLLGEFGTDAWRSTDPDRPEAGQVDAVMQADWDASLWAGLSRHFSANNAASVCWGGVVFAFNDEWWKVAPAGAQNYGGFRSAAGHPDAFANEEWFGLVDIERLPRSAYFRMRDAFAPSYVPPPAETVLRVRAAGGATGSSTFGFAEVQFGGRMIYRAEGGGSGGRGFNLCAFDPNTGYLVKRPQNYDTWATRQTGSELAELIAALDGLADGTLFVLAVADDAGLNSDGCIFFANVQSALARLGALGSARIGEYCFRHGWAMVAVKGRGRAEAEGLSSDGIVDLTLRVELP